MEALLGPGPLQDKAGPFRYMPSPRSWPYRNGCMCGPVGPQYGRLLEQNFFFYIKKFMFHYIG